MVRIVDKRIENIEFNRNSGSSGKVKIIKPKKAADDTAKSSSHSFKKRSLLTIAGIILAIGSTLIVGGGIAIGAGLALALAPLVLVLSIGVVTVGIGLIFTIGSIAPGLLGLKKNPGPVREATGIVDSRKNLQESVGEYPIGIHRPGNNNCCFNSAAQAFIWIDSLREGLEEIPECRALQEAYLSAQKQGKKKIGGEFCEDLRNKAIQLDPGGGFENGQQADVIAILQAFLDVIPEKKIFIYQLQASENFAHVDPRMGRLRENNVFLLPDSAISSTVEELLDIKLTSIRTCNDVDSRLLLMENGYKQIPGTDKWQLPGARKFVIPPKELLFSRAKLPSPIRNARAFTLSEDKVASGERAHYECDYYALHMGDNAKSGHYVCGVKVKGRWYAINDSVATPIDAIKADENMSEAVLLHFARV